MRHFKNLFTLLLLTIPSISCKPSTLQDKVPYDYDDFLSSHLNWEDIFSPNEEDYYVYVYSKTCGHCIQIKEDVLEYAFTSIISFYFVEYVNQIPGDYDVSDTIGATEYSMVSILGTPTLLEIRNHILVLNEAGSKNILRILGIDTS